MKNPLVSICCICYNHEPYVRDALEGFLMQKTTFPFEIVISDDCSSDGTRAIIAEYISKYPDLFRDVSPSNNLGICENLAHVQECAKGKFVALCEGDDYWIDPYKLQKQVDILYQDKSLIACVTNTSVVDAHGHTIYSKRENVVQENKEGKYNIYDFFRHPQHQYPTATVCFKTTQIGEILHKFRCCSNPFLGDWPLWIILHSYGSFFYLDEVTAAYRINQTSITHTASRVSRAKASREICCKVADQLPPKYAAIASELRDVRWTWVPLMFAYRAESRYVPMLGCLLVSIFVCPHSLLNTWKNRKRKK